MNEGAPTILVAEDDSVLRENMADYLEDRDFRVLTAENGRVAIELFERDGADLILTDLRMPEVDGLGVLRRARELSSETPTIVVSGTGETRDVIQALRLGAWDYVLKPVEDMSIIAHCVYKALENARLRRENREYQENLKLLVRERTAELEQANTDLTEINTRLHRLLETTRGLALCSDIEEFGCALLNEFAKHMLATGGSLYLVEGDCLRRLHALEGTHAPERIPFPLAEDSVLHHVMEGGKPLLIQNIAEERGVSPSGWNGYRDGSLLSFPLTNEAGEIVGVLALHGKNSPPFVEQDREIGAILASYGCETLRAIRATESMRSSEERHRTLFESARDAIITLTPPSWTLSSCNPATLALFGVDNEAELLARSPWSLSPEEQPDGQLSAQKAERMVGIAMNEGSHLFEWTHERLDGRTFPATVLLTRMEFHGQTLLQGTVRDMSRVRELEEQLRQSQKMEAVGQLAGGVAHDFNNLLQAIMGYCEMALMESEPGSNIREELDEVLSAASRAKNLVRQLLAFSRRQVLELVNLALDDVVHDFAKMVVRVIGEHITLNIRSIPGLGVVRADRGQMEQVLMNLCVNARDAMPEGGEITITLENTDLDLAYCKKHDWARPGRHVLLSVTDTGCGMDVQTRAHLFEPFFTTKESGKGTGLGLATVYGIVRQHNGMIQVQSEAGAGTTFQICLPVAEAIDPEDAPAPSPPPPRGTETILLAEDDDAVRNVVRQFLTRAGYTVLTAVDGEEAVRLIDEHPGKIDLAMLDVVMPKLGGYLVFNHTRGRRPDTKVLFASGYNKDADYTNFVLDEGVQLMQKPYERTALLRKIREVLDSRRQE